MISFHEIETLTLLIITLASQFVYLLWGQHLFSMIVKPIDRMQLYFVRGSARLA